MISIPEELQDSLPLLPGPTLRRGKRGKRITHFPSRKTGRTVTCESLLEADFCLQLERSTAIRYYEAQPFSLLLINKTKRYTPDFAAQLYDGRIVLYEIKTDTAICDTIIISRLNFYKSIFAECGYPLECIPASLFRHPVKSFNLRLLYHQSYSANQSSLKKTLQHAKAVCSSRLTVQLLVDTGIPAQDIAYAIFHQHLHADLKRPFGPQAKLYLGKPNEHE
ncbi:hypothetical protein D9M71_619400 [compost metagenome]